MKRSLSIFSLLFMTIMALTIFVTPGWAWSGKLAWTYDTQSPISSSISVAGGLVLAGDSAGALHAIYVASGQRAWVHNGTSSIVGQPTVSGESVIIAQAEGTITALSLSNGKVLWRYSPPDYASETLMDGASVGDGKVFFSKGDGKMTALSEANGKPLWTYDTGQELRNAPYFSNGFIFLGEQRGLFSAINPETGKRDWGGGAGGPINTPMTEEGNVYFSSWDGSVHSVKIQGIIPQWKANVGDPVTTRPCVEGDKVFVGTAKGKVVALSKDNGGILWTFETGGGTVVGTPVAAEGLVFVGGGQGTLFALDGNSGAARFTFSTGGGINGTPAFAGGVLFLGSADGKIYAIR